MIVRELRLLFVEEEGEWCPVHLQAAVVIDEAIFLNRFMK
jgi:hypothetical protein